MDKIKNVAQRLGIITVEDMERYTALELIMMIVNKMNEAQKIINDHSDKIHYLLNEGLLSELIQIFDEWTQDGTLDTLINQSALKKVNDRIDETNAQLSLKLSKDGIVTMANMGQDVKEAMTGGSVAVVGKYSVGQQNIIEGSVVPSKMDYHTNLIDKENVELDKAISPSSFTVSDLSGYALTDFIPIQSGKYTINFASHDTIFIYNTSKEGQSCVTTSTAPHTFEVASDGFIRVVIKQVDLNNAMLVHGEFVPKTYIPYGHIGWLHVGEDNLATDIKEKINTIKSIDGKFRYLNLFNKETTTDNVILGFPSDNLTKNEHFCVSDFIRVDTGNYTLNIANYDTVFMYDKDKKLTDKLTLNGWGIVVNTITIPEGISFVKLSVLKENKNEIMFAKGDSLPAAYVPYGKYVMDDLVIGGEIGTENNILSGKTALFTGDSICYGAGSTGGYARYIREKNKMNVINYGVSGTRIAVSDIDDAIVTRIATMQDTADYICLEGGVNDAWCGVVPLGEISKGFNSDLDEETFTGAFESLLKQSLLKWKGAKIFYIIPHKMIGVDDYMNRAKELCEKWGVPCLDLRLMTGFFAYDDEMKKTYTANGDGVHPNAQGYNVFYVDKISAFMKTL